jgi:hypothetical protein
MPWKSPLKQKPLRHAGQSLDEKLDRLWNDRGINYYLVAAGFSLIALMEWVGYLRNAPRYPRMYTALAVVAIGVAAIQFMRLRREAHNLLLGREGERLVGQMLESLREDGAKVFHDVEADGFNLDHVVVSDRGVIVVETKTYTKRSRGDKISFVGEQLMIGGRRALGDPIGQTRNEIRWLANLLKQSTDQAMPVRGALVFPDWWVERPPDSINKDVWVLEPKALRGWLQHEPVRLSGPDVAMATLHLSQYIRSKI